MRKKCTFTSSFTTPPQNETKMFEPESTVYVEVRPIVFMDTYRGI